MPYKILEEWLDEEKSNGASNPQQAILSTATFDAIPHSRVVAIREFSMEKGFVFFTQKGTRKVEEIKKNPHACLTFWLELAQRQVIIEGLASPLSNSQNENYWHTYSLEAQIRFMAYAPTSTQPILSIQMLEDKRKNITLESNSKKLPLSPYYLGFQLKPQRFLFYTYKTPELSEVYEFQFSHNIWHRQLLSP